MSYKEYLRFNRKWMKVKAVLNNIGCGIGILGGIIILMMVMAADAAPLGFWTKWMLAGALLMAA